MDFESFLKYAKIDATGIDAIYIFAIDLCDTLVHVQNPRWLEMVLLYRRLM